GGRRIRRPASRTPRHTDNISLGAWGTTRLATTLAHRPHSSITPQSAVVRVGPISVASGPFFSCCAPSENLHLKIQLCWGLLGGPCSYRSELLRLVLRQRFSSARVPSHQVLATLAGAVRAIPHHHALVIIAMSHLKQRRIGRGASE